MEKSPRHEKGEEAKGKWPFITTHSAPVWFRGGPPLPHSLMDSQRLQSTESKGHFLRLCLPSRGPSADRPRHATSSVTAQSGLHPHPHPDPADPGRGLRGDRADTRASPDLLGVPTCCWTLGSLEGILSSAPSSGATGG